MISAKPLLHFYIVVAKSVLSCDLITLREMIDSLELIKTLVKVAFARTGRPEDVPLVRVSEVERVGLEDGPDQLGVAFEQLVEHFTVIDVVAPTRALSWRGRLQQLCLGDGLYENLLIECVHGRSIQVLGQIVNALFEIFVSLVEEVLLSSALSVVTRGDEKWKIVLHVSQGVKNLNKLLRSTFLFLLLFCLVKSALSITHQRSPRPARVISVNPDPLRLELRLDQFQAI